MKLKLSSVLLSLAMCGTTLPITSLAASFNASAENVRQAADATEKASIQKPARVMASEFLNGLVKNNVLEKPQGWQKEQQQYVALQVSQFNERAPERNPDFLDLRDIAAQESLMKAKESIIRFIRTELSSELVMTLPESGLSTEYDKELERFKYALANAKADYEDALREVDSARADKLAGITEDDLIRQGIGPLLEKETGIKFDTAKIEADKVARLKEAQANLMKLETEISSLKAKAAELQGALKKETNSSIQMLASMPLSGAIVVAQFESWIKGKYEVANIVTWSPKAEQLARKIAQKVDFSLPPSNRSIGDFMAQDWSTATGSRKFVDDKGDYYIIGIGQALSGDGADLDKAQELATLIATNEIGKTILSDVSSESALTRKAQEVLKSNGVETESETEFVKSLSKELSEKVESLQLQGVDTSYFYTVNPITQRDVVLAVSTLSVTTAQTAGKLEKSSMKNAEDIIIANQKSAGVKAGLVESLGDVKADQSAFESGRLEGLNSSGEIVRGGNLDELENTPSKAENVSIKAAGSGTDAFSY